MKVVFSNLKKQYLTELFIMQINNQLVANDLKEAILRLCNELTEQDIADCEKVAQDACFGA